MSTYLFSSLSQDAKNAFAPCQIKSGETLFHEGDPATSVFMVETGCVRMVVYPDKKKELVLYRARDGEAFAEEHLVLENFTYSAIADKDTTLLRADKSEIQREFSNSHLVARSFANCLCKRYYQLRVNFERIGIKSASDRVLHLLMTLKDENNEVNLGGKIKSLSRDLNLTHEATYRALRDLEEKEIIQRNDGRIKVL